MKPNNSILLENIPRIEEPKEGKGINNTHTNNNEIKMEVSSNNQNSVNNNMNEKNNDCNGNKYIDEVEITSTSDKILIYETDMDDDSNRNWYDRYFSNVRPGSIRASIFSLSILCMGTGCLILPLRCKQLSIIFCMLEIIIVGFCAYWTLEMLISASRKCGIDTYSKLIKHYLGHCWSKVFDISVIAYIMGVLTIYNIVSK